MDDLPKEYFTRKQFTSSMVNSLMDKNRHNALQTFSTQGEMEQGI